MELKRVRVLIKKLRRAQLLQSLQGSVKLMKKMSLEALVDIPSMRNILMLMLARLTKANLDKRRLLNHPGIFSFHKSTKPLILNIYFIGRCRIVQHQSHQPVNGI